VFHQYGSGDTQPPTTPTGLATTSVTSSSAALSWNASTDNVGVSGYTVYRNGVAIATTGGSITAYTDSTVAPSTTYSYTVDAFDTAGNHSPQSTPLSVTTPAPPPPTAQWIQGGAVGTGSTVTSTTLSLSSPVHAGDLLVGWFGQYNSSGQVQVSDSVNGAWTRGGGTLLFGSSGDIALYYFQNSAAAPGGLTITISAAAATYLQGSASEFSNVALTNSLDQLASASGTSTAADSGVTGSVAAGELLYSGFMTGTSPGSVTAGGGLTIRDQNGSSGVDDASMLVTTGGPQHAPWTLQTSADWYLVAAAFHTVATTIPSPTNVTATAASSTQVNVGWSTGGGTVSSFTVYRNGLAVASVSGSTFSWSDTTVAPSTTYTYGVDAVDGGGNHSARATAAPVTTPSDTSPPTIPAGASAAALSDTSIKVTWSASTDNVGVTGYTVFRGGTKIGTVGATTLAYTDSGLTPSTAYTYTVDAFDAAGNHSAQSTAAGATTLADTSPPTTPTNLTATASGSSTVNLTWSASSDDVAVVGYTVYRNGTQVATTNGQTLAYSDTGLTPSTTYGYTVDAFDAAGNHSTLSTQASATTAAASIGLTAPGSLTATAASATQINLTWTASTGGTGVAGYTIYRNSVQVGTVAGTVLSYSDSPLAPSTSYTYTVDAFDSTSAHSPQSSPASATTLADTTPPSVPGGVSATALSSTQIKVSWSASTDNVAVTGYTVYRNGTQVGTVGGGILTFSDGGLNPSTLYSYTVDAFDAAANHSAQSAAATATTSGTPKFVQGNTVTTGGRVTSVVLTLSSPVAAGDLLVGFFGQYDVPGQVSVSDNVNGAWTRSASTTWQGGSTTPGDAALYYFAHSAAAPSGLTITISSPTATYLQGGADEYSGVAATNPLDQVAINKGSSTSADSGATAAVAAGELVYGGMIASNGPGTLVAGTGFVKRAQSGSGSQGEEDILSSAAGPQHAGFTFPASTQWFMVCATFKAA
jgi:chitodextrinase